jgi:hypothetical protein
MVQLNPNNGQNFGYTNSICSVRNFDAKVEEEYALCLLRLGCGGRHRRSKILHWSDSLYIDGDNGLVRFFAHLRSPKKGTCPLSFQKGTVRPIPI